MEVRERMWRKDEKAVSPVIGVILMVAITVILAAVIASFVFGMGSNVKKQYVVSVTAAQDGNNITITYQGGPDDASLTKLNTTVDGSPISALSWTSKPAVGATKSATVAGSQTARNHVVVVGTFADGTKQVILDTYV